MVCNDLNSLAEAKRELCSIFSMQDLGPLQYCLGIHIHQDPDKGFISLSQSSYVLTLLKRFNHADCKGIDTPLPRSLKPSGVHRPGSSINLPFANILGGVRYLVTCTRLDICFAANYLSRHMQAPQPHHHLYLKRLVRYLRATQTPSLTYHATAHPSPLLLHGYSDANWGGDQPTMQSTSGFVFFTAGAAVIWQSRKQDRVSLSSTEAEYMAMTVALKEGLWLKSFLDKSRSLSAPPFQLHCDNLSAILLAKNLKHSENTKHIALKLQFIRELVQEGQIELVHVRTQYQWTDF
ncbi:hypothetical protein KP509_1Z226500 [Ceratopteris richardii]|nr:hypothetical protein KP509_1Z226500 [Ceratopteris richardii]